MATSTLFYNFKEVMLQGKVNLTSDNIYVALVQTAPTDFTKTQWSDITGASLEVSASCTYASGGSQITGTSLSIDTGTGKTYFLSSNPVSWTGVTTSAVGAVIYDNSTSTKYLIAFVAFPTQPTTCTNGTFTITWANQASGGIFYFN